MSNAGAFAALAAHIERVRAIPGVLRQLAPEVGQELAREVLSSVRRGEAPSGQAWAPTADGHLPLQGTARELRVSVSGLRIALQLVGVHARHDRGRVRGGKRRPILPRELSPAMVARIRAVLERRLAQHMAGAR